MSTLRRPIVPAVLGFCFAVAPPLWAGNDTYTYTYTYTFDAANQLTAVQVSCTPLSESHR